MRAIIAVFLLATAAVSSAQSLIRDMQLRDISPPIQWAPTVEWRPQLFPFFTHNEPWNQKMVPGMISANGKVVVIGATPFFGTVSTEILLRRETGGNWILQYDDRRYLRYHLFRNGRFSTPVWGELTNSLYWTVFGPQPEPHTLIYRLGPHDDRPLPLVQTHPNIQVQDRLRGIYLDEAGKEYFVARMSSKPTEGLYSISWPNIQQRWVIEEIIPPKASPEDSPVVGPVVFAGAKIVYWTQMLEPSTQRPRPRINRFDRQTKQEETLISWGLPFLGEKVTDISSIKVAGAGETVVAYSTTAGHRIALIPVSSQPRLLLNDTGLLPPYIHDFKVGKILYSQVRNGQPLLDSIFELDIATGAVKTLLVSGDQFEGEPIAEFGLLNGITNQGYIFQVRQGSTWKLLEARQVPLTPPQLFEVTPTSGAPGSKITIKGSNLTRGLFPEVVLDSMTLPALEVTASEASFVVPQVMAGVYQLGFCWQVNGSSWKSNLILFEVLNNPVQSPSPSPPRSRKGG